MAEVAETDPLFVELRQSGFSIYSRKRVWNLRGVAPSEQEILLGIGKKKQGFILYPNFASRNRPAAFAAD